MAANPLHAAISQAQRDNRSLQELFGRWLGTAQHPRGRVLSIYRAGRASMARALRERNRLVLAEDTLREMRGALRSVGRQGLSEAAAAGRASAERQIGAYQADGLDARPAGERVDVDRLLGGWMAVFEQQGQAVLTLLATGQNLDLILGDENRMGVLQPAPAATEGAHHLAAALALGIVAYAVGSRDRDRRPAWQKQVIAAIDERTTDCCLRAHAQIVALNRKFRLTGTPRYADRLDWTPFHWWCRSSVTLYLEAYEDGISAQMRSAANAEIQARKTRGREEIHPAHARSRR